MVSNFWLDTNFISVKIFFIITNEDLCHWTLEHMNATAPTAILPVIQVLSGLIWSMHHEQTLGDLFMHRRKRRLRDTWQIFMGLQH